MSAESSSFEFYQAREQASRAVRAGVVPRLMICVPVLTALASAPASSEDCVDYRDYIHLVGGVDFDQAHGLALADHYAYVATPGELKVVDISVPIAPAVIGESGAGGQAVAVSGDVACVVGAVVRGGRGGYPEYWGVLTTVDISNPAAPAIIGAYRTPGNHNGFYDVAMLGDHAFVAAMDGIHVVDISNPAGPTVVGHVDTGRSHGLAVCLGGHYACVAAGFYLGSYLHVVDISDPTSPVIIGSVETPTNIAEDVATTGNHAYVAAGGSLEVVDISEPTAPAIVGSVGGIDAFGVALGAGHAYTVGSGALHVVDISNTAAPEVVGRKIMPGEAYDVAVAGDHAYVADNNAGLQIVDISNPTSPPVGSVDTPGDAQDVAVASNYAYVADGGPGLQVVDISDRTAPAIVATASTGGWGPADGVAVSGDHVFITTDIGLEVMDVSDPTAPYMVGRIGVDGIPVAVAVAGHHACVAEIYWKTLAVLDVSDPTAPSVVGSIDLPGTPEAVAIAGDYAYVASSSAGLQIVDISNPTLPAIIGSVGTPGEAQGVAVVGDYAYVAAAGLQVVSITNPASPVLVGGCAFGEQATDVSVDGDHAYVTAPWGGLKLVDISTPTLPALVASVDTRGRALGVALAGSYVYIADGSAGLFICPTHCEHATSVELASYEITTTGGAITIVWETAFEEDRIGFHVERAAEGSDAFARVNDELIRDPTDGPSRYEFTDCTVVPGQTLLYRLVAVDRGGESQIISLGSVTVSRALPAAIILHQNHPNPFNPSTSIAFELPEAAHISLRIYDVCGRRVRTLIDDKLAREFYSVEWDGRDDHGREVGSGIYYCRLEAGARSMSKKMVVAR